MMTTRRTTIGLGAATLVAGLMPRFTLAAETFPSSAGEITITPIDHASFVIHTPDRVIHVDPVGGAALYADLPPPSLILITHEHGDHFDLATIEGLTSDPVPIITNPAVHDMLPEALKSRAISMANGDTGNQGEMRIDAVPAYNITEDRLKYHPKGRDNGYILAIGDKRIYIAGDTEDIPEMRGLTKIDIAFLPMNLPYTMTPEQAASAVQAFVPSIVFPYHYKGTDPQIFATLVKDTGVPSQVILADWY